MSGLSALTEALRAFGSAKQLALAAGCHVNTAKSYQQGYTFPDIVGLTRLMARSRAVTNAVLRMAGLDDISLDLEIDRLTKVLDQLHDRRQEIHAALAATAAERARVSGARLGGARGGEGIGGARQNGPPGAATTAPARVLKPDGRVPP